MLKITKSLNNNVILALDENQNEIIAMGTGIGFNRRKDDFIDLNRIDKMFTSEKNAKVRQLLASISVELFELADKIVQLGKDKLNNDINDSILITLSEHLSFAIERTKKGMTIDPIFQWEIPHLYPKEYEVGKLALELINSQLEIPLPKTEEAFIALHFVNAQYEDNTIGDTVQLTETIKKIITLVQYNFHVKLDSSKINYSRFITHLRYFITRQRTSNNAGIKIDFPIKELLEEKYRKSYNCAKKIISYLNDQYGWDISLNELIYLVIHIERVVQENTLAINE